jgi:hypothetical protein
MEEIEKAVNKIFTHDIKNYIFIYTPPKVGSTTLVSSLRISLGRSFNVVHIHDDIMLSVLTRINNVTVNEIINYIASKGKNVYVIDVYRTPIERKMSEFFEKISPYHFNNSEENISKYSMKRITDRFNKVFPHLGVGDHYFEKYDIDDIIPFDFNKKYSLQITNGIKYVKLRLCDSYQWDKILSEILKTDIVLIHDYQTEEKDIGDIYKIFKNNYRLPLNYLDMIKNCKYLKFYYSEKERNSYLSTWDNKLTHNFNPYTVEEYKFYVVLYLENQYINDIQLQHYIDNGCFCNLCTDQRKTIFFKAKNGETINEKIIHNENLNNDIENRNKLLLEVAKKKVHLQNIKNINSKFKPNQFAIHNVNF